MKTPLAEIEDALPNGFHDAHLVDLSMSYRARVATFEIEVDLSEPPEPTPILRSARLFLDGVTYLVLDPPAASYPYAEAKALWVDLCDTPNDIALPPAMEGTFRASFFVRDWNAFIRFEARGARFEWSDAR